MRWRNTGATGARRGGRAQVQGDRADARAKTAPGSPDGRVQAAAKKPAAMPLRTCSRLRAGSELPADPGAQDRVPASQRPPATCCLGTLPLCLAPAHEQPEPTSWRGAPLAVCLSSRSILKLDPAPCSTPLFLPHPTVPSVRKPCGSPLASRGLSHRLHRCVSPGVL